MNEVLITPEIITFIKASATIVVTPEGNEYLYLPYWFEEVKGKMALNVHRLDKPLPEDLKSFIESERNSL